DVPSESGLELASTPATPVSPFLSRPELSRPSSMSTASTAEGNSIAASSEAFNSPPFPGNAIPAPHLPLRKESLDRLQLSTFPALNGDHESDRQPSPTPSPRAGRHRQTSPPRLPKDRQASSSPPAPSRTENLETLPIVQTRARCLTSGSRDLPPLPLPPQLSPSTSIPELAALRRQLASSQYRPDRGPSARYTNSSSRRDAQTPWDEVRASYRSALTNGSYVQESEIRSSIRSAWTNGSAMTFASSSILDASETERSSV